MNDLLSTDCGLHSNLSFTSSSSARFRKLRRKKGKERKKERKKRKEERMKKQC